MPTLTTHRDEPSTDASLLRSAQDGHDEDWQRLVHIYGPSVYRWIRVRNRERLWRRDEGESQAIRTLDDVALRDFVDGKHPLPPSDAAANGRGDWLRYC